jgi:ankyrin repeat protein
MILGGNLPIKAEESLRTLFWDEDWFEEQEFPLFHQIVLGKLKRDLEEELHLSRHLVNEVDFDHRTALSWAAQRGDRRFVDILLQFGADPNIPNRQGMTPLLFAAAHNQTSEITNSLLHAGANPSALDLRKWTALHHAAIYQDNPSILRSLLAAGLDVKSEYDLGATALSFAARKNHVQSLLCLIGAGGDINKSEDFGTSGFETSMTQAVEFRAHEAVEILLENGASYTNSVQGWNILHTVASDGDVRMMQILTKAKLQGLDPNATNWSNKAPWDHVTPRVVFSKRSDLSPELEQAFEALLKSIPIVTALVADQT